LVIAIPCIIALTLSLSKGERRRYVFNPPFDKLRVSACGYGLAVRRERIKTGLAKPGAAPISPP
jgi:hypothetical protein